VHRDQPKTNFQRGVLKPCPIPDNSAGLVAGFTQGGFPGLPVLRPLFLPGGHDTALPCLPQHPAAGKLYPNYNIVFEEKHVTFSGNPTVTPRRAM
jgi:hypothetical protein